MIKTILKQLKEEVAKLSFEEQVEALNEIKEAMNEISPFNEPIDVVRWISQDKVKANDYNPNKVASPEMKLLHTSIKLDGYTQPIVAYKLEDGNYEVIDGFHRNRVGKEYKDINERIHGYLPLVVIDKPLEERMGSTIRHNRARGTHQIKNMSDIVLDLIKQGWNDEEICKKLGMDLEEVMKLKQMTGLKEAFMNHEFSRSWEEFKSKYNKNGDKGE